MRAIALETIQAHPVETVMITLNGLTAQLFQPSWPRLPFLLFGQTYWKPSLRETLHARGVAAAVQILQARGWTGVLHMVTFLWEIALMVVIYFVAFIAVVFGIKSGSCRPNTLLSVIIVVYVLLLAAGPEATARFRVPIMPFLCLLTGLSAKQVYGISPRLRSVPLRRNHFVSQLHEPESGTL